MEPEVYPFYGFAYNEDTCRKPKSYFLKRILAAIGKKLIETSER